MSHTLSREAFQQALHGQRTDLFTLHGAGGLQVAVSNYGARLVQVAVPDGQGGRVDVALGYGNLQGYLDGQLSMGALIGRWAGRLRSRLLALPDEPACNWHFTPPPTTRCTWRGRPRWPTRPWCSTLRGMR